MYSKRRTMQKILAAMISVIMLLGMLPISALADEDESALRLEAPVPMLGSGNGLAMWAGEKLAGGVVSSISGYGVNQAMGAIFGTQTDQVLRSLEEIKEGLRDIKNDISNLAAKLEQQDLKNDLNDYGAFINKYVGVYDNLSESRTKYANDAAMTRKFLQAIYGGKDADYMIGGDTLVNATINLGNELTRKQRGNYNIFGAYDQLDRFTNVWEHQGYDRREKFQLDSLNIYTMYSAMSLLACKMAIESNPGNDDDSIFARSKAEIQQKQLMDNADKVNKMAARCAVIRHPNLRIARNIKQGTDLCAFWPDVYTAWVVKDRWGDEKAWADYSSSVERYTSIDYLWSMTRDTTARRVPWSEGWVVYTNQATPEEYKVLFDNYGGKYSLYDIFFDKEKGNFSNAGGLSKDHYFLSNEYVARNRSTNQNPYRFITWESRYRIDNNAKVDNWLEFSSAWLYNDGHLSSKWFSHDNAFSINKYMGEVKQGLLQAPNPSLDIEYEALIAGMEGTYELPYADPVTLEVSKAGDTYQWSVNKNDDKGYVELENETKASYTLPSLTADMNGWQYGCTITEEHEPTELLPDPDDPNNTPIFKDNNVYTYALPVILNLAGVGISDPATEHVAGNAAALQAALNNVDTGEWDLHTLKLTNDITYPYPIYLDGMHSLTLDLNGYTLTVQPGSDAEPNVSPMSDNSLIAAICLNEDKLEIKDSSGDDSGLLNIIAGQGIDYGIYAANGGIFKDDTHGAVNVTSAGGGTAIYADGGNSNVSVSGNIQANGDNAYGAECLNWSTIVVSKNVTVSGKSACGAYMASFNGDTPTVRIEGDITVSGEKSRGIILDADTHFIVNGSVTVKDGIEGVTVSKGFAVIEGDVTAPNYAINAWGESTQVEVTGNVFVTKANAVAVSAVGNNVHVKGNVTSSGSGGIGVLAAAIWTFPGDVSNKGATVIVDGKISAVTPLLVESTPVTDESDKFSIEDGYNVFAIPGKGASVVKAKPDSFEVTATSLVTFDKNGGDTEASPSSKAVITDGAIGAMPTAPARSGYSFVGWNTQANGGGTSFTATTVITGSVTVFAQWSRNSSNGSSSGNSKTPPAETPPTEKTFTGNTATATTTTTATVDNNGKASAAVTQEQVSDAISQALAEAQRQGDGTAAVVKIKVEAPADATTVETSIPKAAMELVADGKTAALIVSSPIASISFAADALSAISGEAAEDVKITASKVEVSALSAEAQQAVGDRPVFNFNVTSGDTTISEFGGSVSVTIPYTPKTGEDTDSVVIYYINAKGNLEIVSNCVYDPATGTVSFKTNHFSQYAIGYNKVSFKDVAANVWYSKAVGFIAARSITTGTGDGNYSPDAKLTRGDFLVMMMRTYGLAPAIDQTNNFADAGNTYYTGYLAAAKRLGISGGVGNNMFAPGKEITRQEMFTLLYNALKVIGELPEGNTGKPLSEFSDSEQIASWAKDAMKLMTESGAISGSGGKLSPANNTTRAEMAQVIYNLLIK